MFSEKSEAPTPPFLPCQPHSMFSEKTEAPYPPSPHPQLWFFSFSTAVTWKIRSRSPNSNQFLCPNYIYLWKLSKNPTTGSQDIVRTRKCETDADTDINANPVPTGSTPKSICLFPWLGGHNKPEMCVCKTLCLQLYECPYKMLHLKGAWLQPCYASFFCSETC